MIVLEESPPVWTSERHGCIRDEVIEPFQSSKTYVLDGNSEPFEYKAHMHHEEQIEQFQPVPRTMVKEEEIERFPYQSPMFYTESPSVFRVPSHELFYTETPEVHVYKEPRAMFHKEDIHTHPYKAAMFVKQEIECFEYKNAMFKKEEPTVMEPPKAMFYEEKIEPFDYASPIYFEENPEVLIPNTALYKEEKPEVLLSPTALFIREDIKPFEPTKRTLFWKEIPDNDWKPRSYFSFQKPEAPGKLFTLYKEDQTQIYESDRAYIVQEDIDITPASRAFFIKEEPQDLGEPVTYTIQEEPEKNMPIKTAFRLEEKIEIFYVPNHIFFDDEEQVDENIAMTEITDSEAPEVKLADLEI